MSHDLVIRGGNVVDGTGTAAFAADIAIDGDQISEIGKVSGKGKREIDADGLTVTPGICRFAYASGRPDRLGPTGYLYFLAWCNDRITG